MPGLLVQVDLVGLGRGSGQVVAWGLAQVQVGGVLGSTGAGPALGAGGAGRFLRELCGFAHGLLPCCSGCEGVGCSFGVLVLLGIHN